MAMTISERCEWGTVDALLPKADRERYAKLSCEARDSTNTNAWWLADPMYTEPGNERRSEHFSRLVRIALHKALTGDERWDLREQKGGDAIQTMLLRYGWPTVTFYGGLDVDASHDRWLRDDAAPPYTVPEYTMDRVATLPSFEAMRDPLTVQDSDFVLNAPFNREPDQWWPTEHFRPRAGVITTIPQGQTALFRRDSATLFAVATKLTAREFANRPLELVEAILVLSPFPDSVQLVSTQAGSLGRSLLMQGSIPSGAAIAGIELPGKKGVRPAARSRFGIVSPPTLASMKDEDRAVSEPVLFDPSTLDAAGTSQVDHIFDVMHSSTLLQGVKRVGVYWESYGFEWGDSVDVSVQVERVTRAQGLRRIGMALRVVDDPNGTVTARWTEPEPGRSSASVRGLRPILSRQIVLNIANFADGTYRLRVAMRAKNRTDVFGDRVFRVLR